MRGFRTYILLVVLPLLALQQSTNQKSVIDQMTDIPATMYEKYLVFSELKVLINHADNQMFKYNLKDVIQSHMIYGNTSEMGYEAGAKAIDNIRQAFKTTENPENFINFLDICCKLMQKLSDSMNWLFFHGAVDQISKGVDVSEFKKLLRNETWKLPKKILDALGVFDEVTVTTPIVETTTPAEITTTTVKAPENFVFGPIGVLGYTHLNDDWNQEPFFQNSSFLEILKDNSSKYDLLFFHSDTILDELQLSKNDSYRFNIGMLYIERLLEDKVEDFYLHLKALWDIKEHESLFEKMISVGNSYYETNGSEFDEIRRKYDKSNALQNYFDLLATFYKDRFTTIRSRIENSIAQIKKFNEKEFNALLKFIKLATNTEDSYRWVLRQALGRKVSDEYCLWLWNHWNEEEKKKEMIGVVKEMHDNFNLNSCGIQLKK